MTRGKHCARRLTAHERRPVSGELGRTRERTPNGQWWTRSRDAYADCEAWAEPDGYPVPPAVVWGTTLTRLGIKSVVKKARGHSVRMRNLRLKPSPEAAG